MWRCRCLHSTHHFAHPCIRLPAGQPALSLCLSVCLSVHSSRVSNLKNESLTHKCCSCEAAVECCFFFFCVSFSNLFAFIKFHSLDFYFFLQPQGKNVSIFAFKVFSWLASFCFNFFLASFISLSSCCCCCRSLQLFNGQNQKEKKLLKKKNITTAAVNDSLQ